MNNRDYWNKREEEALKHYTKNEQEYQKRLNEIYQTTLDNCQKEINSFFGKYAKKEGITIAEAKKRVSQLDIKAYERKAKQYVKDKDFSAKANEEMRLYNLTMKVNRLEMLKANIGAELIAGHDELDKFMGGILKGRAMEELQRQAGILGKTVLNATQKADALVNASFKNATFSDRIWMYQDELKNDIGKLLTSGLIQGKNPRTLAKDLKAKFNTSTSNAERLMRTELARVQTEAQKQSYQRNGWGKYEFIVNRGCCPICEALDGKHFSVEKMQPGFNAPPMHPNCRCATAPYEDSEEYEAWLDYLSKGGTTEKWNATERAIWKSQRRHEKQTQKGYLAAKAEAENDWSNALPRQVAEEEKSELIKYAEQKGIVIPELRDFDGDTSLLRAEIDALSDAIKKVPTGKKIVLSVSNSLADADFAETSNEHITLNAKVLRSREVTEKNLSGGNQFASTNADDIVVHEYGHVLNKAKGNVGIDFAKKAYYHVYGESLDTGEMLDYLSKNVSEYAVTMDKKRHPRIEITPEILAKDNYKPDEFTREYVRLLQEAERKS